MAIHDNENLPNIIKIAQNRLTLLQNIKLTIKRLPKTLYKYTKVVKFRQICSRWWPSFTVVLQQLDVYEHLMELSNVNDGQGELWKSCQLFFSKKWANPVRLFSLIFGPSSQIILFHNKFLWKMFILDSNSQPLGHESPSSTTRPVLPPKSCQLNHV